MIRVCASVVSPMYTMYTIIPLCGHICKIVRIAGNLRCDQVWQQLGLIFIVDHSDICCSVIYSGLLWFSILFATLSSSVLQCLFFTACISLCSAANKLWYVQGVLPRWTNLYHKRLFILWIKETIGWILFTWGKVLAVFVTGPACCLSLHFM